MNAKATPKQWYVVKGTMAVQFEGRIKAEDVQWAKDMIGDDPEIAVAMGVNIDLDFESVALDEDQDDNSENWPE